MEEHHDNPVFGRKVFFLNPPYSIKKVVLGKLQELEYEIYVIEDYRDAKNILRHYKDSICFINVDEQLSSDAWFNFITSFEKDESLKSIFLGIISERMKKPDKDMFMLKANIPAGFISLTGSLNDITETLQGILEINGAKGRRQYVRAQCAADKTAMLFYTSNGKMYQMKLLDISSVGSAVILPFQYKDLVQPNSIMREVTLTLGTKQVQLSTAVFAIKESEKFLTLVLLFLKGTPYTVRSIIRDFVFDTLNKEMFSAITGEKKDDTNYNLKLSEDKKKDDAFLIDIDDADLKDADIHMPPSYDGNVEDLTITNLF